MSAKKWTIFVTLFRYYCQITVRNNSAIVHNCIWLMDWDSFVSAFHIEVGYSSVDTLNFVISLKVVDQLPFVRVQLSVKLVVKVLSSELSYWPAQRRHNLFIG